MAKAMNNLIENNVVCGCHFGKDEKYLSHYRGVSILVVLDRKKIT